MDDLDAHIEKLPAIARFLQVSESTVKRLKCVGAMDSVLMTKRVRTVTAQGKLHWSKINYSTGRLLMAWQLKRGGLEIKKSPRW